MTRFLARVLGFLISKPRVGDISYGHVNNMPHGGDECLKLRGSMDKMGNQTHPSRVLPRESI